MQTFHPDIVACFLYIIGKYGYPPPAEKGTVHLEEFSALGFRSIELEGIREEHLMKVFEMRRDLLAKANDLISTYQEACDIAGRFNLTYLLHPCHGALAATTDAYLRFHDAVKRGYRVEHLVPGDGAINWSRFFEMLDRIQYRGWFGIDVGGAESYVQDYEKAYVKTAKWLESNWFKHVKQ